MSGPNYYEVLGVAKNATQEQIKKAYRALARKHHPDVSPGNKDSERIFKEAQQAYDILSEPDKRKVYDQVGHDVYGATGNTGTRPGGYTRSPGGSRPTGAASDFIDFGDIFGPEGAATFGGNAGGSNANPGMYEEIFSRMQPGRGSSGRKTAPQRGRDYETKVSISFLTAIRGGETNIEVTRDGGQREFLSVKIPTGVKSGAKLRLKGRGETGASNRDTGDLIIEIQVEPHPYFAREDQDLSVEVPITVAEAILGAKIEVPTPNGLKTFSIPHGTSSGQRLRLKGLGVPAHGGSPTGDLFVIPRIVVPKSTDDVSDHFIRQFDERIPLTPRDGLW